MKIIKNKNYGFTLIELLLVLGIGSMALMSLISYENKKLEITKGESVGQQYEEIGKAFSAYVSNNNSDFTTLVPTPGSTAEIPICAIQDAPAGAPACSLPRRNYIGASLTDIDGFGNRIRLFVRNNGLTNGTAISYSGLVLSDGPTTDETGSVRYDWLGYAMRKAGSASGITFLNNTQLSGLNAGWTLNNTQYPQINKAGLLAYRTGLQNNYDDVYLRRDGLYPMTNDLNMGNYSIRNATDINFNGWLNGNNALLNNLTAGYIYNNGNMYNEGNIETTSVRGSGSVLPPGVPPLTTNYAMFDTILANVGFYTNSINPERGNTADVKFGERFDSATGQTTFTSNLYANDMWIDTGRNGRQINTWLSDRLPRYSSRGVVVAKSGDYITKVDCGTTGVPKVELILQNQYIQGRVMGTLKPVLNLPNVGPEFYIEQDQYSVSGTSISAVDVGNAWQVNIETPVYDANYVDGAALGHVYCDFGT